MDQEQDDLCTLQPAVKQLSRPGVEEEEEEDGGGVTYMNMGCDLFLFLPPPPLCIIYHILSPS